MRKKKSTASSRQDEQHRDINRGAWTPEEDARLAEFIQTHQKFCWRSLPKKAGLNRCGKSCRLRWMNYLRPDIKRGNISKDEEELIIRMHRLLGNRWSLIAGRLPGRTDNEIKNYWNTHLSKKVSLVSSSTTSSSYSSIICEKKQISLPCVTSDASKNDDQSSGSLLQVSSSKKEELLHGGSEESNNSEIAAHDLFIMDKAAALYDEQHGLLLDFDSQEDYFFMQSMLQTAVDNDATEKQKHDYNEHTVGWVPVDGILGQWMHMNYSN